MNMWHSWITNCNTCLSSAFFLLYMCWVCSMNLHRYARFLLSKHDAHYSVRKPFVPYLCASVGTMFMKNKCLLSEESEC